MTRSLELPDASVEIDTNFSRQPESPQTAMVPHYKADSRFLIGR